jgi:hypothetical protein
MAYFAALIPGLRETEPYRFIMPGVLLAGIFGSPWFASLLTLSELRTLPGSVKAILVVVLVLLAPRAIGQIAYFIPEVSPEVKLPSIVREQAKAPPTTLMPVPKPDPAFISKTWRLRGVKPDMFKLADVLDRECNEDGRFLIQHWVWGEFLSWALDKPTISGFPDRRMLHEAAFLFRRPDDPRFWDQELADYLVRYNIRYVVMTEYVSPVEQRRELLEPFKLVGPHRIYRVRHRANYFMRGSGRLRADLNRIEVFDAEPAVGSQTVTLRFHHMETLRCRPGCRVVKAPIPHDPVGFITVVGTPTLPSNFVIENRY